MPFRNGTFVRTNGRFEGENLWVQADADHGKLYHEEHDFHDQDIADGIRLAFPKAGGPPAVNDIDFGGYKLTLLGAPVALTDAGRNGKEVNSIGVGSGIVTLTLNDSTTITATEENVTVDLSWLIDDGNNDVNLNGAQWELRIEKAGTDSLPVTYPEVDNIWTSSDPAYLRRGHAFQGLWFSDYTLPSQTWDIGGGSVDQEDDEARLSGGLTIWGFNDGSDEVAGSGLWIGAYEAVTGQNDAFLPEDGTMYILWPALGQEQQGDSFYNYGELTVLGDVYSGTELLPYQRTLTTDLVAPIDADNAQGFGPVINYDIEPLVLLFVRNSDNSGGTFHLMEN